MGKTNGRPPFAATDEQRDLVAELGGLGIPMHSIAKLVKYTTGTGATRPIGLSTLEKHFAPQLAAAMDRKNVQVAQALFRSAMEGNTTAQIFWLKCRARWKEQPSEVAGPDGAPLLPSLTIRFVKAKDGRPVQGDD